MTGRNG